MRFSYWANSEQSWDRILAGARHAETARYDGVYVADHFMPAFGDDLGPYHECWALLAALAAAVPRVRLGSLVAGNTYRHPAVLAKQVATIDHISSGRAVLGLGAGWQENEHEAYGLHFGSVGERMDRLEEACRIITGLFAGERTTVDGDHYAVSRAPLEPKPVQEPLPLLIGGGGEQRTMRIAARYATEWNIWGTPELLGQKGAVLDSRCEEIQRDPREISHSAVALLYLSDDEEFLARHRGGDALRPTIVGTPAEVTDIVAAYRNAGVDELIIPDFNLRDPERRDGVLSMFAEEVLPAFR